MSAIEELIRKKLKVKLAEAKKEIAAGLIAESPSSAKGQQMKTQQISAMQKKIQDEQKKPNSTQKAAALKVMQDKLKLKQDQKNLQK
jgi:hypothetical protein